MSVPELCRMHGFSDATFYKWRAKFDGLRVDEARRLRELLGKNGQLKKLLAEAHLDIEALKADKWRGNSVVNGRRHPLPPMSLITCCNAAAENTWPNTLARTCENDSMGAG